MLGQATLKHAAAFSLAFAAAASVHGAGVKVIIENLAPDNGTWLTPFWVGFHDGSFDTHDVGSPASMELERLAEDGNTGPMSEVFMMSGAGNAQGTIISSEGIPPLAPGESATMTFILDGTDPMNRYFSFASMVIPSNDAFIGNDGPTAHQIFDGEGDFLGAFIMIYGSDVKDAGTEINDELPEHTAFFGQSEPDSGVDENGVVHYHAGYMPLGSGGILDDPMFANADFTQGGYEVARITIVRSDTSVPAGPVWGVWDIAGSPYLLEGDVYVPNGETLVIEPGVVVFAQSWFALEVNGTLIAQGTEEQPITFTAIPPGPGEPGWKSVRFVNADDENLLEYCIIENGQVMAAPPFDRGGGVYVSGSNLMLDHCTLRDNRAVLAGGGVWASNSTLTIADSTITANLVGYESGGGGGGVYASNCTISFTGDTVSGNDVQVFGGFGAAHGYGAGVYLDEADGLVSGNIIADNTLHAEGNVGTSARGGGLYISDSDSDLQLTNNTLHGNSATVYSGPQEGAGMYLTFSSPEIVNTIVAASFGGGIHFDSAAATQVSYSDFHNNSEGDFTGSAPAGLGDVITENANGDPADMYLNIFLDPMFVDAGAGDYNLMEDSPCIDAGDPMSPLDPDGTVADIGALYFDQGVFGDINGDGVVNTADLLQLLADWGPCPGCPSDLNGDGVVDTVDLLALLAAWS